jgi:hypothetical protein
VGWNKKNVMKIFILIAVIILNMSCSKDEESSKNVVVSVGVEFYILNQTGDDLLNSATHGYFSYDKIKLYYLINGEKVAVQDFDPQVGGNNGLMLNSEKKPYTLKCITYNHGENGLISDIDGVKTGIAIAFLELSEGITDTIKTEWESKEGKYFVNKKIWYNGELHEPVDSAFEVRK